jgi:hypothetical protein
VTTQVLFNGQVIVRPGAYTQIDASQFQNTVLQGLGIVGLIGEAEQGRPRFPLSFLTPADVKASYVSGDLVEAAAMVADPSADPRIPAGAQQIVCYKVNNSARSTLTSAPFTFTSLQWGVLTNNITVAVAVSAPGFVVTITNLDAFGSLITEVSPVIAGTGKFTIQYTGAGTAATLTTTATALTTTVTGAAADNLNLNFSDYSTLALLIQAIAATGKYTVTSLVTNSNSFASNQIDLQTAVDVKTALTTIFAKNADVSNWVNANSQQVSSTFTLATAAFVGPLVATQLTGGTRGTSANADWVTGFTALQNIRVNQAVPLASADAVSAQGTFTIASIVAATVAYAKLASSTAGQNEVQAWVGVSQTKTNFITTLNTANSEHLVAFAERSQRPASVSGQTFVGGVLLQYTAGQVVFFPEWSTACIAAGMRAGAPLGEPITWKYGNVSGVSSDSSWSEQNNTDVVLLELNGGTVLNTVRGRGFRFDKVITTFTKSNNDAYTEETIVQIWKLVAFNLRQALQDAFVGRGGSVQRVSLVPAVVATVMQPLKDAGAITDSVVNGQRLNAWRKVSWSLNGDQLTVSVTVTPTPGINYVLTTIVLVPAQISGAAA